MRRLFFAAVIAALAAGGCATVRAKAKVQPQSVTLEAPAPPPRVIVPPEPEVPESPVPSPEPESVAPKTPRRQPPPAPVKTEPKSDSARPAQAVPPGATLQQALPAAPSEIVRQVRERLGQAQNDLKRVDYRGLTADGKSQYETAQRFIEQAEQAIKEKNLVFAAKVAEKAAGLAASLVGRLRS